MGKFYLLLCTFLFPKSPTMYMNILNKGEKNNFFLDGSASKPDGDASLQAQETPAPPTQVPTARTLPRPSHRAVQPQEGVEGVRARPGTPLRKPLQPFRTEKLPREMGLIHSLGDAANCKGPNCPTHAHHCPHWPTHLRGPGS